MILITPFWPQKDWFADLLSLMVAEIAALDLGKSKACAYQGKQSGFLH